MNIMSISRIHIFVVYFWTWICYISLVVRCFFHIAGLNALQFHSFIFSSSWRSSEQSFTVYGIALGNSIGPPTCESCAVSSPAGLLASVHHDLILHSASPTSLRMCSRNDIPNIELSIYIYISTNIAKGISWPSRLGL